MIDISDWIMAKDLLKGEPEDHPLTPYMRRSLEALRNQPVVTHTWTTKELKQSADAMSGIFHTLQLRKK